MSYPSALHSRGKLLCISFESIIACPLCQQFNILYYYMYYESRSVSMLIIYGCLRVTGKQPGCHMFTPDFISSSMPGCSTFTPLYTQQLHWGWGYSSTPTSLWLFWVQERRKWPLPYRNLKTWDLSPKTTMGLPLLKFPWTFRTWTGGAHNTHGPWWRYETGGLRQTPIITVMKTAQQGLMPARNGTCCKTEVPLGFYSPPICWPTHRSTY